MNKSNTINILLADDDRDDCLFFKEAIDELSIPATLTMVNDGEQLMQHLETNAENLPDALFLDLNMPRKNGFECLTEIKKHPILKDLPVIIHSTSYNVDIANQLYNTGANYYICKPSDFEELKNTIYNAIVRVKQNFKQTPIENFLINKFKAAF